MLGSQNAASRGTRGRPSRDQQQEQEQLQTKEQPLPPSTVKDSAPSPATMNENVPTNNIQETTAVTTTTPTQNKQAATTGNAPSSAAPAPTIIELAKFVESNDINGYFKAVASFISHKWMAKSPETLTLQYRSFLKTLRSLREDDPAFEYVASLWDDYLTSFFRDIERTDSPECVQSSMRCLGFFLYSTHLVKAITASQFESFVSLLSNIASLSQNKTTMTLILWLIGIQNVSPKLMTTAFLKLLDVTDVCYDQECKSGAIVVEAMVAYSKLCSQCPVLAAQNMHRWFNRTIQVLLSKISRDRVDLIYPAFMNTIVHQEAHAEEFLNNYVKQELKTRIEEMRNILTQDESNEMVMYTWTYILFVFGAKLHRREVFNETIRLVELFFNANATSKRFLAYQAWVALIYSYSCGNLLVNKRKPAYCIRPLTFAFQHDRVNSRKEAFNTWLCLLYTMDSKTLVECADSVFFTPLKLVLEDAEPELRSMAAELLTYMLSNSDSAPLKSNPKRLLPTRESPHAVISLSELRPFLRQALPSLIPLILESLLVLMKREMEIYIDDMSKSLSMPLWEAIMDWLCSRLKTEIHPSPDTITNIHDYIRFLHKLASSKEKCISDLQSRCVTDTTVDLVPWEQNFQTVVFNTISGFLEMMDSCCAGHLLVSSKCNMALEEEELDFFVKRVLVNEAGKNQLVFLPIAQLLQSVLEAASSHQPISGPESTVGKMVETLFGRAKQSASIGSLALAFFVVLESRPGRILHEHPEAVLELWQHVTKFLSDNMDHAEEESSSAAAAAAALAGDAAANIDSENPFQQDHFATVFGALLMPIRVLLAKPPPASEVELETDKTKVTTPAVAAAPSPAKLAYIVSADTLSTSLSAWNSLLTKFHRKIQIRQRHPSVIMEQFCAKFFQVLEREQAPRDGARAYFIGSCLADIIEAMVKHLPESGGMSSTTSMSTRRRSNASKETPAHQKKALAYRSLVRCFQVWLEQVSSLVVPAADCTSVSERTDIHNLLTLVKVVFEKTLRFPLWFKELLTSKTLEKFFALLETTKWGFVHSSNSKDGPSGAAIVTLAMWKSVLSGMHSYARHFYSATHGRTEKVNWTNTTLFTEFEPLIIHGLKTKSPAMVSKMIEFWNQSFGGLAKFDQGLLGHVSNALKEALKLTLSRTSLLVIPEGLVLKSSKRASFAAVQDDEDVDMEDSNTDSLKQQQQQHAILEEQRKEALREDLARKFSKSPEPDRLVADNQVRKTVLVSDSQTEYVVIPPVKKTNTALTPAQKEKLSEREHVPVTLYNNLDQTESQEEATKALAEQDDSQVEINPASTSVSTATASTAVYTSNKPSPANNSFRSPSLISPPSILKRRNGSMSTPLHGSNNQTGSNKRRRVTFKLDGSGVSTVSFFPSSPVSSTPTPLMAASSRKQQQLMMGESSVMVSSPLRENVESAVVGNEDARMLTSALETNNEKEAVPEAAPAAVEETVEAEVAPAAGEEPVEAEAAPVEAVVEAEVAPAEAIEQVTEVEVEVEEAPVTQEEMEIAVVDSPPAEEPARVQEPTPEMSVSPVKGPESVESVEVAENAAVPETNDDCAMDVDEPAVYDEEPAPMQEDEPVPVVEDVPVETAPMETVETAAIETVKPAPVETVEPVPVETVETAPMEIVEATVIEEPTTAIPTEAPEEVPVSENVSMAKELVVEMVESAMEKQEVKVAEVEKPVENPQEIVVVAPEVAAPVVVAPAAEPEQPKEKPEPVRKSSPSLSSASFDIIVNTLQTLRASTRPAMREMTTRQLVDIRKILSQFETDVNEVVEERLTSLL